MILRSASFAQFPPPEAPQTRVKNHDESSARQNSKDPVEEDFATFSKFENWTYSSIGTTKALKYFENTSFMSLFIGYEI